MGALVSGVGLAGLIRCAQMLIPERLANTPFAGEVLTENAPVGAITVFLCLAGFLAMAMVFLPTSRRYAFGLATVLLSSPTVNPARGWRPAVLGGLWNLLHFFLGLVVCALTVVILPIGFGALAQMMGLERSLEAVSISISQTTAFLLSVGFFGFLICLPYVANQLARWLRLLARHLMVDEIGDAGSERVYHARVRVSPSGPNSAAVALSSREQEILVRVAEGLRNREIAERIFITGETVKSHMSSILAKLGVDNRTQAVSEALRLGILDIETRE